MADEPSLGELGRGLTEIKLLLQDIPGRREYSEFQNYVNHRFGELDADLIEERHAREAAVKEIRDGHEAKHNIGRTGFYAMLGTLLAGIALEAVNAWLKAGGHG